MRQKTGLQPSAVEKTIKDIRRSTLKHHSTEDKIRIVPKGIRGKKRLASDTARSATSNKMKALRRENHDLKEVQEDKTILLERERIQRNVL